MMTEAEKLLAKGELDEQSSEMFSTGLSVLLSEGMPVEQPDGTFVISKDLCTVKEKGKCDIVHMLQEALENISSAVSTWSPRALSSEVEDGGLIGMASQITTCIRAYDMARTMQCFFAVREHRNKWSTVLDGIDDLEERWEEVRAECFFPDLHSEKPDNEMNMKDFEFFARKFFSSDRLAVVRKQSSELDEACTSAEAALAMCNDRFSLRTGIWDETFIMNKIFSFPMEEPSIMFGKLASETDGLLTKLVELAASRKVPRQSWTKDDTSLNKLDISFATANTTSEDSSPDRFDETLCESFFVDFEEGDAVGTLLTQLLHPRIREITAAFSAGIDGLLQAKLPAEKEVSSCGEWLEKVLGKKDIIIGMAKAVADILGEQKDDDDGGIDELLHELPAVKMSKATETLIKLSSQSELPAGISIVKDGSACTSEAGLAAVTFFTKVACLLHTVSYIVHVIDSTKVVETKNDKSEGPKKHLCDGLVMLIDSIGRQCSSCAQSIEDFRGHGSDEVAKCIIDPDGVAELVKVIEESFLKQACKEIIGLAMSSLAEATKTLLVKSPRFQHIITKTKYSAKLVKAQLLDNPARQQLPQLIAEHFNLVSSISEKIKDWQNGNPAELPGIEEAESAIEHAKEVMAVIAGANIIDEFGQSSRGPELAEKLLSKKGGDFPGALKDKLKALAAKKG